jgi:hypothetical protein
MYAVFDSAGLTLIDTFAHLYPLTRALLLFIFATATICRIA